MKTVKRKILDKLELGKITVVNLDGDIPNTKSYKAIVDGEEREWCIAYDLPHNIGIYGKVQGDVVEFIISM